MKRILILGSGSYLGRAFAAYLVQWPEAYEVVLAGARDGGWEKASFAGVDALYFTAGIAHVKETPENAPLYQQVNCDLAVAAAQKAKAAGVGQFIYLSSMSVYGMDTGVITKDTPPRPVSAYGQSKLAAEQQLTRLADERFKVVILRPPMVYGRDCKGNFQKLVKLVAAVPVFPAVCNRRSMIYIDTLNECVRRCIQQGLSGLYCPQNREYISAKILAEGIAKGCGKRIRFSRTLAAFVPVAKLLPAGRKVFGTLIFDDSLRCAAFDFAQPPVGETVEKSVVRGC